MVALSILSPQHGGAPRVGRLFPLPERRQPASPLHSDPRWLPGPAQEPHPPGRDKTGIFFALPSTCISQGPAPALLGSGDSGGGSHSQTSPHPRQAHSVSLLLG